MLYAYTTGVFVLSGTKSRFDRFSSKAGTEVAEANKPMAPV